MYINELGDDKLRFKSTGIAYIFYAIEGLLASFLCYIVLTHYKLNWRVICGISGTINLVFILFLFKIKESPLFLLSSRKFKEF